jgi:BASS family bile acid:Na+ symporter
MSAHKLANDLFNASLSVMLLTLVASLGMTFSVRQILAPVRKVWLLLGAILANSLLAPLIAIGVCHLFPLSSQARTGVELVTIAAIGPAALKACQLAKRADLAMAVSFTVVIGILNVFAAPLWAKAMISGASVSVGQILGDLALLVLLPLVVGAVLRARYTEHAVAWKTGLEKVSDIALYLTIGVGLALYWKLVVKSLGTWVIVCSAVIILIYIAMGWAVGLIERHDRQRASITNSMLASLRFTPIGLIVISTVLKAQGAYLAPALIFCLLDTFIPFGAGAEIGRRVSQTGGKAKPATQTAPPKPAEQVPAGSAAGGAT